MAGMTYTMTDTTKLSTAECYGIALCELGEEHKDVVALTADLAKSTKIGMFGEHFPDRFFNVGIAELQEHLIRFIQISAIRMFLLKLLLLTQVLPSVRQAQLTILLLIWLV